MGIFDHSALPDSLQVGYARIQEYDQETLAADMQAAHQASQLVLCRFGLQVSTDHSASNILGLEGELQKIISDNLQLPEQGSPQVPAVWLQSCSVRLDEEPLEAAEDENRTLEWSGILRLEIGITPDQEAPTAEYLAPSIDGLSGGRIRWMTVRPLRTFGF